MNGQELNDYTAPIEARSYYFVSDGKPRFIDVDAMDNRTTTATTSNISAGKTNFRQALIECDRTCVLTSDTALTNCDACHLIPHSKKDTYMSSLFDYRHEMYDSMDPLNSIDDARNGLLLNVIFHRPLDLCQLAFLKTPNFALTVDDIPYRQPPNAGSPPNRLTLQHIKPSELGLLSQITPHNSDARQPQDTSKWPPAIIVDLSYAVAALQAWGPKTFIEYVRTNSRDVYYPDDVEGGDGAGPSRAPTAQAPHPSRSIRYKKPSERQAKAFNPEDQSTSRKMDLHDVVLSLWMRAAREARDETKVPGSDVALADNENRIWAWLQSMEATS
ncbi:hypothetical protein HD554DRAFT_2261547 [Boletus coccyginus]|nr:hypothetical protein HD554DRAFT_2261547 [Boletus coccyginus]